MIQRVLIIDDEENMRHMLSVMLTRAGYEVSTAKDGMQGYDAIVGEEYDVVLCDLKMPQMDGLALLQQLEDSEVKTIFIMMSAYGTIDNAVEAMKIGAYDFITKPFKSDEVLFVLQKAFERMQLQSENRVLKQKVAELQGQNGFGEMVVNSQKMLDLIEIAQKTAKYGATVLISGESGTGKELFARGIHNSGIRGKPFVAVNCGSFPEQLLESEFFGYAKGAFTGAESDRKGLFEEADSGTLFLDEIGELPLSLQVKFLRVLQEGEVRPVGALESKKVNVRIIAATAKNLEEEVAHGRFRKDLFYRLNVVAFHLPPLRERKDDILGLSRYFVKKINQKLGTEITGISPDAMKLLLGHDWPGNVRELENAFERAAILSGDGELTSDTLVCAAEARNNSNDLVDILGTLSLKKARNIVDAKLIDSALQSTGGNKTKAAEILEVSYPSLLSKIKEFGIS